MKFNEYPPMVQDIIREQLFFWDWEINPPDFKDDEVVTLEWFWGEDGTLYYDLNGKYIDVLLINPRIFEQNIQKSKDGQIKITWGELMDWESELKGGKHGA